MKRLTSLAFLFFFLGFPLFADTILIDIVDTDRRLTLNLEENLPAVITNVVAFITPFDPAFKNSAGDGAPVYDTLPKYSLQVTVSKSSAMRDEDHAFLAYAFDLEFLSGNQSMQSPDMRFPGSRFSFTAAGAGPFMEDAEESFLADFRRQLLFELARQPLLRRDICVLYIYGKDVVLTLPREKKLKPGMEFDMLLPNPDGGSEFSGRLVITEMKQDFALGRMLYEDKPLRIGAVGKPAGTVGLETKIQAGFFFKSGQNAVILRAQEGFRLPTPWVVPFLGLQVPFFLEPPYAGNNPVTVLIGAAVPWFSGKIRIYSAIAGGIGYLFTEKALYAGMLAEVGVELRLNKFLNLSLSGGYTGWVPPAAGGFVFSGFFIGLGTSFLY